jgi:NitT/TauT family transport system substrate-binding protein
MKTIHKYMTIALVAVMVLLGTWLPGGASAQEAGTVVQLKVALLPIFDVLPFYVAREKGYFKARDVEIQAVPVGSGLERDQLMQAGEIDGMLNEMISTAGFNRKTIKTRIISIARHPYPQHPSFRLITAPGLSMDAVTDMAGIPVAVSKNTIIEYVADRLMAAKGLVPDEIKKISVPVIPERYQLLMQGQIQAAVMPDPLALSAIAGGAGEVLNDAMTPQYSASVLTFSTRSLAEKKEAVRLFVRGWHRAVEDINQNPQAFRDLLLKNIRVPKNINDSFTIPRFPHAKIPDRAQWKDVIDWMMDKGLLDTPVSYDESVTGDFFS